MQPDFILLSQTLLLIKPKTIMKESVVNWLFNHVSSRQSRYDMWYRYLCRSFEKWSVSVMDPHYELIVS